MTNAPPGSVAAIDLTDPALFASGRAHDAWRRLRAHAPVAWHPGTARFPGFWTITRYEDVRRISRDTETFVSGRGYLMVTDPRKPGPAAGIGKLLLGMDAPRHRQLRRLASQAFTPRVVAQLELQIRATTDEILDAIVPHGGCDFATALAAPLPLAVICTMLGVPREDWHRLLVLGNRVLGAADPEYQLLPRSAAGSSKHGVWGRFDQVAEGLTAGHGLRGLLSYFARLIARRRLQPGDNLLSLLLAAEIDGERLTDEELQYFCYLLVLAGNETTRHAISGGMLAFLEHPTEWQRLRADPGLLPTAVEEIMRWSSPILHMARVASCDVEMRGQHIRAGEKVVLWYPSANRDEHVFAAPDRFDIGRHPNPHLAFGIGPHFCLGAWLARLQLRVIFAALVERVPGIVPAGEAARLHSVFIGGIKHLPVRFDLSVIATAQPRATGEASNRQGHAATLAAPACPYRH